MPRSGLPETTRKKEDTVIQVGTVTRVDLATRSGAVKFRNGAGLFYFKDGREMNVGDRGPQFVSEKCLDHVPALGDQLACSWDGGVVALWSSKTEYDRVTAIYKKLLRAAKLLERHRPMF